MDVPSSKTQCFHRRQLVDQRLLAYTPEVIALLQRNCIDFEEVIEPPLFQQTYASKPAPVYFPEGLLRLTDLEDSRVEVKPWTEDNVHYRVYFYNCSIIESRGHLEEYQGELVSYALVK